MLIEREESLAVLRALLARVDDGRGGVALVSGEAGVGKTSLLGAFSDLVDESTRVAWGRCDALFTPRPLGPLHDMAGKLGSAVRVLLGEGAPPSVLFPLVFGDLELPGTRTVLIFEDIHWADHATLDLIRFLGRRIAALPVLLILSYRSDEVDGDGRLTQIIGDLPASSTQRIALSSLSPAGVKALAQSLGRSETGLHDITAGNPFFVTELLASPSGMAGRVPASIKDAVGARLSRLTDEERDFLETVSIVPGSIERPMLHALYGVNADRLAASCLARGLLAPESGGALRFRHELARLATIARLSAADQQALHRKVLDALLLHDVPAPIAQLVHHAASARLAGKVLEYAPLAARQAASLGAHREAAAQYATALRFVAEAAPETAAQLYEDWAYEAGLATGIDDAVLEARRYAVTLWRALGRSDKVGQNLRWLSRLHWYRGEAAEAERLVDEAARLLENEPASSDLAMTYSVRSQFHMLNDRMDEAVAWGRRAIALADTVGEIEPKIHALNNIGTARAFRGHDDGPGMLEESLRLALAHGFHEHAARVYTNLAEYAIVFRDFPLAERVVSEGIAFDTKHDLDAWTHYLVGRQAQLRLEQGRFRDARTIAQGVLGLERLTLVMRLPALIVLAKAQLRLGESDASGLLEQALEAALATDEAQNITPVLLGLAEAAWLAGVPELAGRHLSMLAAIDAARLDPWQRGEAAAWRRRLGNANTGDPVSSTCAPFRLEADGKLAAAADAWEALGQPYEAAMALLQAEDAEAVVLLSRAVSILEALGARPAAKKARNRARELGLADKMPRARRGPYATARNHPLGLTGREQDVLRWLVTGASNKQIAERLFRSERTVEHQVSSLLAKLGAANRMEAVLRVHNQAWILPQD